MRYIIFIILSLTLSTALIYAQQPLESVHFEIVNNRILIDGCSINGSNESLFVFDTGAGHTVLFPKQCDHIKLIAPEKLIEVKGIGGTGKYSTYPDNNLSLGNISLDNLNIIKLDIPTEENASGKAAVGIIGVDLLKKYAVEIDFDNSKINFYQQDVQFNSNNMKVLKTDYFEDIQLIKGFVQFPESDVINGLIVTDTGNPLPVIVQPEYAEKLNVSKDNLPKLILGGFGPNKITAYQTILPELNICGFILKQVPVYFLDRSIVQDNSILHVGMEAIKRFNYIYRYKQSEIIVEPSKYFNLPFAGIEMREKIK